MIAVRSNRDRGAIEPRSWSFRRGITSNGSDGNRRRPRIMISPQSWPNRRPIVARSWPDRGKNRGYSKVKIVAKLWLLQCQSGSHDVAQWRPLPRRINSTPQPRQSAMIFWLIFPSKTLVFSLCSSTFDRFVKELSQFQGRSLVHRDPLVFRLDCEAIGAGLITNFSLISSNFPLEFRTSMRTNPSKFASIHENWSPILAAIGLVVRFDRLSGGNFMENYFYTWTQGFKGNHPPPPPPPLYSSTWKIIHLLNGRRRPL